MAKHEEVSLGKAKRQRHIKPESEMTEHERAIKEHQDVIKQIRAATKANEKEAAALRRADKKSVTDRTKQIVEVVKIIQHECVDYNKLNVAAKKEHDILGRIKMRISDYEGNA